MHTDFFAWLDQHAGRQYDLHAEHLNPAFVKMLRAIGFDKAYVRGEGCYLWDAAGNKYQKLQGQPHSPSIDAAGNSDCQVGQFGYIHGPLITGGRYRPARFVEEGPPPPNQPSGGSHVVGDSNTPGLAGPTFTGVPDLAAVDEDLRK